MQVTLNIRTELSHRTLFKKRPFYMAKCFVPIHHSNPHRSWALPGQKIVTGYGYSREEAEEECTRKAKKVLQKDKDYRAKHIHRTVERRVDV